MRIGVFGSCRVKDPLRAVGAEVRTHASFGHIHNPLEIIQAIEMMAGRTPPPELLDLMNLRYPERLTEPLKARVFVVEVSSLRLVEHRGWQLQIHRFRDMLQGHGVAADDIRVLYEDMEGWRRRAAEAAKGLPDWPAEILLNTAHREMSGQDVTAALDVIAGALPGPVLFVGPITHGFGKAPLQRAVLRDALRDWGDRHGVHVFDPTPLVTDADLIDLGHYQPHALPRIGDALQLAVGELLHAHSASRD